MKSANKKDALQVKNAQWKRLANSAILINLARWLQGGTASLTLAGKGYSRTRKSCMVT